MVELSVGSKVARGSLWSIALNVVSRGLGLISIFILARLITPYDLGVYAAAAVVIELVTILTEVGIYPVLIQRKDPDTNFYQTAWTIGVVRGIIIFLSIQLFALNFIQIYTDDAAVGVVMQVISVSVIIGSLRSIYMVNFQREIDFKSLMRFSLVCRVSGFLATIIAAYLLRSFWALVIGNLVTALMTFVLSYSYAPGRHRINFKSSKELLQLSRWMLVHEIASFVSIKADTFLITRFLGPRTLGIYDVGYQIAMAPTQEVALPISRALFPGFAKLQGDSRGFAEMLSFSLATIFCITLPAGVGLALVADSLVSSLFPENWQEVAQVIQVLSVFAILRTVFGPCISALMGSGHIKANALLTLLNMLLRCAGLAYGLLQYGLQGLLIASVVIALVQAVLYLGLLTAKGMVVPSHLFAMSWRAVLAVILMAAGLQFLFGASGVLQLDSSVVKLLASVFSGCLIYCSALLAFWLLAGKPVGVEHALHSRVLRYLA